MSDDTEEKVRASYVQHLERERDDWKAALRTWESIGRSIHKTLSKGPLSEEDRKLIVAALMVAFPKEFLA